jgi:hypothetical protein
MNVKDKVVTSYSICISFEYITDGWEVIQEIDSFLYPIMKKLDVLDFFEGNPACSPYITFSDTDKNAVIETAQDFVNRFFDKVKLDD